MPSSASDSSRHLFESPPTSAQLSALLPAPRADHLTIANRGRVVDIAIASKPIWFLLPFLAWFGLVVMVAPWFAPLWGGEFIGWGRWLLMVLTTWMIMIPAMMVLMSWWIQRRSAGDSIAIVGTQEQTLFLPLHQRTLAVSQIFQFVELVRWAEDHGEWQPVVQTSVVVETPDKHFEVFPLVTQIRPGRFGLPLADSLAEVLPLPVLRVKLTEQESREV